MPRRADRAIARGMEDLLKRLRATSPYDGFDPTGYPDDVQGWGSHAELFRDVIRAIRPRLIVEVGSWKGASAIFMADIVRDLGLDTRIVCIDTWLGSPEHALNEPLSFGESLRPRFGYPQLYYTFLANVVRSGHAGRIVPLPQTSENAAVILPACGLRPDLVYIDGAHEFAPALRDFKAYWRLLSPTGVLIGDDFTWERGACARAAIRFARDAGVPYSPQDNKFVVSRHPAVRIVGRRHGPITYRDDAAA